MKGFIALIILLIGMVSLSPPGDQLKAATTDQISFVVDHSPVAPVCAVMASVPEEGGVYLIRCYNQIDGSAILMETGGQLTMDNYTMISPPKSANMEKVYAQHLNKLKHPPLLSKRCIQGNKVWPDYGLIRIRCLQESTEDTV